MTAAPAPRPIAPVNDLAQATSPALGDGRNEQLLLGAILMQGLKDSTNTAFKKVLHFEERYFVEPLHRIIFRAMRRVYDDNQNVEYDSVRSMLKNMPHKEIAGRNALDHIGEPYLGELCRIRGGNIGLLSELVARAWIRRHETLSADEKKKWAADGELSIAQFLEKVATQSKENLRQYTAVLGGKAQSMSEGMAELEASLASQHDNPESAGWKWHTGFDSLDIATGGGYEKEQLYLFGGRPGTGKSIMLLEAAIAIMNQGGRPFILSLEMTAKEFWQRMLARESGVEYNRIHAGNMDKQEAQRVVECLGRLKQHKMGDNFLVEFMRAPTLAQIHTKVFQEANDRGVDTLIIDYLSYRKVTPLNDKLPPNQQQANFSQCLITLAQEFKIPVIAAVQMSRESEKRGGDPILGDLDQSSALDHDSFFVGLLKDDDVKAGADYSVTNCHVPKARGGKIGVYPLVARKSIYKFEDMRG